MGQSTGEQATEPSCRTQKTRKAFRSEGRQMQLRHGSSTDGKVWLL